MSEPLLLSITELGGYPDFSSLYEGRGFRLVAVNSMRKALSTIRKQAPDVIVTEFNFQSDFRDRSSSIETLMATLQGAGVQPVMIVFYEKEYQAQFDKVTSRYQIDFSFSYPIDVPALEQALREVYEASIRA